MGRKAAGILVAISGVMLVVSLIGFVVTLVLNAFVLDDYDAYGEVPIPGSAAVHLPAGQVIVSFHTQVIGSPSGGGLPVPHLELGIDPPAGVAEPQVTESIGGTTTVNNDARRRVWLLEVSEEGTYQITTDGQVNGFISPRLAFGHSSSRGDQLVWAFVGLFVIGLVGLIAGLWWRLRTRRRAPAISAPSPVASYFPTDDGIRLEQLKTLSALRESGALSDDEFEAEKRRILDRR